MRDSGGNETALRVTQWNFTVYMYQTDLWNL